MKHLTRRSVIAGIATLPLARSAQAALVPYTLSTQSTSVGFTFNLSGVAQSGTMPIKAANIEIDTSRLQNSRVSVTLNVAAARTRLPFARGPMLGQSVLDAEAYPTITFNSTDIQLSPSGHISNGAQITGELTVRGVTKPVTLLADLYRRPGSKVDDLNSLSIRLAGALDRHAFGASGYPELVADEVGLNIRAEVIRTL
ncbi:YceI family protein [Ruegeria arenilitoris]|uniref:YceI family protein n=1 Tax=Ruegeria arenilitoris TaxID=1173585 RepID=UPI00147D63DB|nr:YceI family protein [Ruegeria arenilitoris]